MNGEGISKNNNSDLPHEPVNESSSQYESLENYGREHPFEEHISELRASQSGKNTFMNIYPVGHRLFLKHKL